MRRSTLIAGLSPLVLAITACSANSDDGDSTDDPTPTTLAPTTAATVPTEPSAPSAESEDRVPDDDRVEGTIVRFAAGDTSVDVTITTDSPTSRDFLSRLPLTLPFEELSGREKIAYLPDGLETDGSPGYDPEDGDLIYYVPWGNLGFYYNADGIDFSDATIELGTYNASIEQIEQLENGDVTIEIVS